MTTNCNNCQTENRANANFCKNCSLLLADTCPRCNFEVQDNAKFCDNCQLPFYIAANFGGSVNTPLQTMESDQSQIDGAQIATSSTNKTSKAKIKDPGKSIEERKKLDQLIPAEMKAKLDSARVKNEMVGERRTVTMLFCDVKGSTEAAEQLDPEYWAEIMNEGFEYMISPIYKYEGTVARLMGDAILAFFGAPITHEDDPTRAILAGLDIAKDFAPFRERVKEQWGIDVNVRIGINTGMVMVGQVGNDLQMEYTAMGDAINLASRMEQTAKPGTVQISEATYKSTSKSFEFNDLGVVEVKGKEAPIQTYRPISKKIASHSVRGFDNINTPLIGRDSEWSRLCQTSESVAKGIGQIVFINGEAGLGKTRLIRELKNSWELGTFGNDKSDVVNTWFDTSSLSYETAKPYGLFQRLIKRVLDTKGDLNTKTIQQSIGKITKGFPQGEIDKAQKVIESIFGLTGLDNEPPLEGESFKAELFRTIISFWEQKAQEAPLVLVFDDLHWADSASVALLEHLLILTQQVPILIICSTRPERKAPNWKLKQYVEENYSHRLTQINVRPLSDADSIQLIEYLLNVPNIPTSLQNRILEKTEGNPFFIEEIIRLVLETNAKEDGTLDEEKLANLTQDDIDIPDNLQALLISKIDKLQEDERHTLQLAALIGRSFYYRILASLTKELPEKTIPQHLNVFQQMDLIREAARDPELEYSFRHALTQEAAYNTILLKKRRVFHKQVAEVIEELFADQTDDMLSTLANHFENGNMPEKAYHYTIKAGDQAYRLYALDDAIKHYKKAMKFVEKIKFSQEEQEYLYLRLGRSYELNSNYKAAFKNYKSMEKNAKKNENKFLELSAIIAQSTIYSSPNDLHDTKKGNKLSYKALALAREIKDEKREVKIQWNLMNGLRFTNENHRAIEAGEAGIKLARKLKLPYETAILANDLPHPLFAEGKATLALEYLKEARGMWKELGNIPMLGDSLSTSSMFNSYLGEFDKSIKYSEEGYKVSKSINNFWGMAYSQFGVIEIYRQKGEIGIAISKLEGIRKHGIEANFSVAGAWADIFASIILRELGLLEKGLQYAHDAVEKFEKYNLPWQSMGFAVLSGIYYDMKKIEKAEEMTRKRIEHESPSHASFIGLFQVMKTEVLLAMTNQEPELAIEISKKLIDRIEKDSYFVYTPEAFLIYAQALINANQPAKAEKYLSKAEKEANNRGANWLLWQIYYEEATIYMKMEKISEGNRVWKKANTAIDSIIASFEDDELKDSFLKLPKVVTIQKSKEVA